MKRKIGSKKKEEKNKAQQRWRQWGERTNWEDMEMKKLEEIELEKKQKNRGEGVQEIQLAHSK